MTATKSDVDKGQPATTFEVKGDSGIVCREANFEGGFHLHLHYPSGTIGGQVEAIAIAGANREIAPLLSPVHLPRPDGQTLDIESPMYIERKADRDLLAEILLPNGLATIKGARKTGKSSMIMRAHAAVQRPEYGLRAVFLDFNILHDESLDSSIAIWQAIIEKMARDLPGAESWQPDSWNIGRGKDWNLDRFFDTYVFAREDTPVLICLDEVNRVMGRKGQADFFAQLRALWSRGAMDATWRKVRWLLSTSSEPSFFIEDLDRSPFNIGLPVPVGPFTVEETAELARRYGISMDRDVLMQVMDLVGGRPFLVSLLLYQLGKTPRSATAILDSASAAGSIFVDHLNRYLTKLQRDETMAKAMREVIAGRGCPEVRFAERLQAAGLIVPALDRGWTCACRLYSDYFKTRL